jgi:hypothetical protein
MIARVYAECALEPEPVLIPSTESELLAPLPVGGQALSALVEVMVMGEPLHVQGYMILQHQGDEEDWQDVAWHTFRHGRGLALFVLQGGDRVQAARRPARPPGQAPEPPAGSHPVVLYGRFRFVGQAEFRGGRNPTAVATIRWKRMGLLA